jgi:hypothetical protein
MGQEIIGWPSVSSVQLLKEIDAKKDLKTGHSSERLVMRYAALQVFTTYTLLWGIRLRTAYK